MKAIEQEQKARSSNFELLRIAAMLMIVGSHFAQHSAGGNWEIMLAPMMANTVAAYLLGSEGQLGVCLFIILSAWFLCDANGIHIRKWFMIGLQTMMCTFITFFILYVTDAESVGSREFLKCFLTPCRVGYWFITTYLCFYLTVPVLQFIERKAVLCGFEKPLFAAASAIPVFSFLFGSSRFGTIGTFFALFFICAYLKRRKGNFLERHCAAIFIAAFTFIVSAMCVVNYFGSKTMYIRKAEDMGHYLFPLYASREVIVMTEALALFYIFKRFVRISHSSVINAIARTTLGVYVISDNWMFILYTNGRSRYRGGFLFEHLLHGGQMFFSSRYYALYFIAVVSGVFIVCSLIEYVRSLVFDRLILDHCSCFTALCGKFDAWYRLL